MASLSWVPSSLAGPAMWVVRISDFLGFETMPSHEELLSRGLLVRQQEDFFCIFVSHEWLGVAHPDPEREQLSLLQAALQNLLAGGTIEMDLYAQFYGHRAFLSKRHRSRLKEAHIWLDWFSIPQRTLQPEPVQEDSFGGSQDGNSPSCAASGSIVSQDSFIQMIPGFVEKCDLFVVLVPRCRHTVTGLKCSFGSWSSRGWCRLELWCKMMSMSTKATLPVVVISAPDKIEFAMPITWIDLPPHEGDFTYEEDRRRIFQVVKMAVSSKIRYLNNSRKLDVFRFFVARYDTILGRPLRRRTLQEFLSDFRFKSLESAKRINCMSPIVCAVLAGDEELLKILCNAGLDVNRWVDPLPEVYIVEAMSPLMLALWLSWRSIGVVTTLLEHNANVHSTTGLGNPVLGFCASSQLVELLLQHRADVNQQSGSGRVSPLTLACARATPPSVIATLLKHGAHANPSECALASAHPLSSLGSRASMGGYCLEVAALLLEARADANIQYRSSGAWRAGELMCRVIVRVAGGRAPPLVHMFAEWSTTPLGFACFNGADELVQLLLDARADPDVMNERGNTPFQLARSRSVLKVLHHHQTTFSI